MPDQSVHDERNAHRFALKRLRDQAAAEHVTQEVFFTVFNDLPSFQGTSSLLVWIFFITRNTVNRRLRGHTAARPSQMPGLNRASYRNMAVWVVILAIMLLVVTILRPEQMA
jgi:DNA-directed RNA polymerase specialized sigma24 family protein